MTPPPPGLCPPLCPGGVVGSRGGRGHIFVLRALAQNGRTLHSHSMDRSSVAWQSVTCRTVPVACRGHKSAEISPAFPLPSHAVKGKDSFALTPAQMLYGLAFALARAGGRRARRRGVGSVTGMVEEQVEAAKGRKGLKSYPLRINYRHLEKWPMIKIFLNELNLWICFVVCYLSIARKLIFWWIFKRSLGSLTKKYQ